MASVMPDLDSTSRNRKCKTLKAVSVVNAIKQCLPSTLTLQQDKEVNKVKQNKTKQNREEEEEGSA